MAKASDSLAKHIPNLVYDHQYVVYSLEKRANHQSAGKRFFFELACLKEEECKIIIDQAWQGSSGNVLAGLENNMNCCASMLRDWHKTSLKTIQEELVMYKSSWKSSRGNIQIKIIWKKE